MCPNSSLMFSFPLRHPRRLPETRLKAENWRKKVIFLDSWCLKLFFITSHINSHLKFTFISPGWFTSQSFYTPNFIFHLTLLILFVNKAPLPSSISSQQKRFFFCSVSWWEKFTESGGGGGENVFVGNWQVSSSGEKRTNRKLWQSRKLKRQTWVELVGERRQKIEHSRQQESEIEFSLN